MAVIQNMTERDFILSVFVPIYEDGNGEVHAAVIPGKRRDPEDENKWKENGIRGISDEFWAKCQENKAIRGWIDEGFIKEAPKGHVALAKEAEIRKSPANKVLSEKFSQLRNTSTTLLDEGVSLEDIEAHTKDSGSAKKPLPQPARV